MTVFKYSKSITRDNLVLRLYIKFHLIKLSISLFFGAFYYDDILTELGKTLLSKHYNFKLTMINKTIFPIACTVLKKTFV